MVGNMGSRVTRRWFGCPVGTFRASASELSASCPVASGFARRVRRFVATPVNVGGLCAGRDALAKVRGADQQVPPGILARPSAVCVGELAVGRLLRGRVPGSFRYEMVGGLDHPSTMTRHRLKADADADSEQKSSGCG